MARAKRNGNGRVNRREEKMTALELAQANLVQAQANLVQAQAALALNMTAMAQQQAAFLARVAKIDARVAKLNARMRETDRINSERFERIETILLEHSRILAALPDAIRDKIGFKTPPAPSEE